MFEDNNHIESDLLMRSILEDAQEEVPASVWEGVSEGLDKAARRKTVVLWWKRAGISTVAAAAAVAAVLVLSPDRSSSDFVPQDNGEELIAVVEKEEVTDDIRPEEVLIAQAEPVARPSSRYVAKPMTEPVEVKEAAAEEETEEVNKKVSKEEAKEETVEAVEKVNENTYYPVDWGDEGDEKKHRVKTSLVVSGLTGTNSAQNSKRANLFKRPTVANGPMKTGISETSTNTTYGIPLSFGAGVKIEFNPKWSLGIGANYSLLPRKFYGTYTKVNSEGIEETSTSSDIRNTQHYIGIPVNAYYNIVGNRNLNLYAYAGGTVEKCVTDKYEVLNTSIIHKEKPAGVQLSANLGIGVEFILGKHLGLYIDPSLRYYFDCNQPKSIRTAQPLMLGFEMGLRARL